MARSKKEVMRREIAQRLLALYDRCMQAERIMTYDKDQKEWMKSDEWKVDAKGAAIALEQLSVLMGLGEPPKGSGGEVTLRLSEEAAERGG